MNQTIHTDLPLVSIIVITYNSAKTVIETLESAKAQTYRNIELIITDDCSKDDTVEVCKKWLDRNQGTFVRTELISVPVNTGTPANCNRGVKAANGQWIKLIAGDDLLLNSCIAENLMFVKNNPAAKVITSALQCIDKDSNEIETTPISSEGLRRYYLKQTASKQLKIYARAPLFLNTPAFFIEKQVLIEINYFDEDFSIFEDTGFIYAINEKGWRIYYLNKPTVKYRITNTSISRVGNKSSLDFKDNELKRIYKKYRFKHLYKANIIDLSVYYDLWLYYNYKGIFGFKGLMLLKRLSLNYWYLKYINKNN